MPYIVELIESVKMNVRVQIGTLTSPHYKAITDNLHLRDFTGNAAKAINYPLYSSDVHLMMLSAQIEGNDVSFAMNEPTCPSDSICSIFS